MSKKLDYEIKSTPTNLVETEVSEPVKPSSGGFINSVQGWGNTNVDHEHDADSERSRTTWNIIYALVGFGVFFYFVF